MQHFPRVIEAPMAGLAMPNIGLVSLTTIQMHKAGFAPSILMLTYDIQSGRGSWLISYERLERLTNGFPMSSTKAALHLEGFSFVGESMLEILMSVTYTLASPNTATKT